MKVIRQERKERKNQLEKIFTLEGRVADCIHYYHLVVEVYHKLCHLQVFHPLLERNELLEFEHLKRNEIPLNVHFIVG